MSLKNYCFTGIPHFLCSQNPSSSTQMPVPQLLQCKTAASTRFTVSQVFQRQGARRTPPAIHKCLLRSFCVAKLQRALVLLFHRCSNARVLADPLAIHQCPFRSFCVSKTAASTRFTVSPEYRTSCARIPRTPPVAKSMLR